MNFAIADDRTRIPVYSKVMQPGDLIPPWERRSEGRFRRTGNLGDNLGGNAAGLPPGPSTSKEVGLLTPPLFRPRRFLGPITPAAAAVSERGASFLRNLDGNSWVPANSRPKPRMENPIRQPEATLQDYHPWPVPSWERRSERRFSANRKTSRDTSQTRYFGDPFRPESADPQGGFGELETLHDYLAKPVT
jgi:hypothetical protein